MNGSIGQLPAPAPWPASEASTRVTPFSTATTELATDNERFSWAWMPISVRASSTSRYAVTRSRTPTSRGAVPPRLGDSRCPSSDGYSCGNGLLAALGMGWIVGNSLAAG